MPEVLQENPLIIVVIVLVLVLLIAIPVLIRRRRASADEVLPPTDVGAQVDYTSLPYEEPTTMADRFRNASIGTKLLLFLVPLVLIVGGVIGYLAWFPTGDGGATTQNVIQYSITNVEANVAGANKILVRANTNLPNGAQVMVTLLENGQGFAWIEPQSAIAQVNEQRIQVTVEKAASAPTPREGQEYAVVLSATAEGQEIKTDPSPLDVPAPVRGPFFGVVAAATSTPTSSPTAAPSPSTPTAIPAASPVAPTEPTAAPALSATVFNGGNIRPQPQLGACNGCPQLHAGETVTLLEKTEDGRWYKVKAPDGEGWVSVTLLRIDAEVARQVPLQGQSTPPIPGPTSGLTATVFNGGNVRETPVTGRPLDQVNAGETVQLLEKTADGAWYKLTTIRSITGWVSVTLLRIDAEVAKQVPIAR
jgi:flagellar FliL protein